MDPNRQETLLSDLRTRRTIDVVLQFTYSDEASKKNVAVDTLLRTLPAEADEYHVLLGGDRVALSPRGWNLRIYIEQPKQVAYHVDCYEGAHGTAQVVKSQLIDKILPDHLGIDALESIEYQAGDTKVPDDWGLLSESSERHYAEGFMIMRRMAKDTTVADTIADAVLIERAVTDFARQFEGFVPPDEQTTGAGVPKRSVFICHSSKDKRFVRKLVAELRQNSVEVWYDEDQILVGHDFIVSMESGIASSDFVAVVLTPNFVQGPWAQEEYRSALTKQIGEKRVVILPALKRDCDVPELIQSKAYADFRRDFQRGFRQLVRAITEHEGAA